MKLLLDTHYIIELIDDVRHGLPEPGVLEEAQRDNQLFASVVSLWEAEAKYRLGKLPLVSGVRAWPDLLKAVRVGLLSFTAEHVFASIGPEPENRDPFDRALLSTAAAERCRLLTKDRQLLDHPLAWRPFLP